MPRKIGLDYLTLLGVSPIHFIQTAAQAGCDTVGILLEQTEFNPDKLPDYSMIKDAALRRDVIACARDSNITIALIDGFFAHPEASIKNQRRALEIVKELGCPRINMTSFAEWNRTIEEAGILAEMTKELGLELIFEGVPPMKLRSPLHALELINAIGAPPHVKLLIDTMHLSRAGQAAQLAQIDPARIGYVQLSDGPMGQPYEEAAYMEEAMHNRLPAGEGEMPLIAILRAIPQHIVISNEVPLRKRKRAGATDLEIAKIVVSAARSVLEKV